MKISQLKSLLQKAIEEHGDVDIYVSGESLCDVFEIRHRSTYYDDTPCGELKKGNYVVIELFPVLEEVTEEVEMSPDDEKCFLSKKDS